MKKACFLDFYGTVVHEDGEIIKQITKEIYETGNAGDVSAIGAFWWEDFQNLYMNAYGKTFQTQRELELQSLVHTLTRFESKADPVLLSERMFAHWRKPPVFEESKPFFEACPVPIYIVSNIDREDIRAALTYHNLNPEGVFTSEDARSYKPRRELFELALKNTGLSKDEVVHIGDSMSSDVKGAGALGIPAIWLNRSRRDVPDGVPAVADLMEALAFL